MPIETQVYDELKAKLSDSKVKVKVKVGDGEEEKSLLDWIVHVEEGVEKTRAANKDLTGQRETWEKERKEMKTAVDAAMATKDALEKQIKELSGKTGRSSEEKDELTRQVNALNDQIKQLQTAQAAAENKAKESEERAKQANIKASEEGLRKDLLTELGEHKIIGLNADVAVTTILAKEYAKLKANDSGLYERTFKTVKDGKELAADIKTLCKWVAETMPFLVTASGKAGTGMNHNSNNQQGNQSGNRNYLSMIS